MNFSMRIRLQTELFECKPNQRIGWIIMKKSIDKEMLISSKGLYSSVIERKIFFIILAAIILSLLFIVDVMTGPAWIPIKEVISTILFPGSSDHKTYIIVWIMRLPVATMAVVVGASLGMAGAEMQTILDNPLASPYTLGISSAASFGAALGIVAGSGILPIAENIIVPVNAFIFAFLSSIIIYFIAKVKNGATETIVLAGITFVFLFNSLVSLLQYLAKENELQSIVFWMFGSLIKATWPKVAIVSAVLVIVIPFLILDAWKLTALRLGDNKARSLGVNVERLRLKVLIIISIVTAVAVCFVGTIGFIGLVAPHLARTFVGEDQRFFMPFSALIGAVLLSFASVTSKLIIPGTIFPIGIVTALIGIPFLISIILTKKRLYW